MFLYFDQRCLDQKLISVVFVLSTITGSWTHQEKGWPDYYIIMLNLNNLLPKFKLILIF